MVVGVGEDVLVDLVHLVLDIVHCVMVLTQLTARVTLGLVQAPDQVLQVTVNKN